MVVVNNGIFLRRTNNRKKYHNYSMQAIGHSVRFAPSTIEDKQVVTTRGYTVYLRDLRDDDYEYGDIIDGNGTVWEIVKDAIGWHVYQRYASGGDGVEVICGMNAKNISLGIRGKNPIKFIEIDGEKIGETQTTVVYARWENNGVAHYAQAGDFHDTVDGLYPELLEGQPIYKVVDSPTVEGGENNE